MHITQNANKCVLSTLLTKTKLHHTQFIRTFAHYYTIFCNFKGFFTAHNVTISVLCC